MDTANDYRFKMAEYAVQVLRRRLQMWGMPWPLNKSKALKTVDEIQRLVKKLRYSYLPPDMLLNSEELKSLVSLASELRSLVLPSQTPKLEVKQRLALAEIKWGLLVLLGLPYRIRLGAANHPEYAVDVVGVEVTRVEKMPGKEKLKVTRASTGNAAFTIVTNIENIERGQVRAAALLPPVLFDDVISEAMYSSQPIDRKYIGKRVPRKLLSGELAATIIRLAEKVK